jgi:hypothetical protein
MLETRKFRINSEGMKRLVALPIEEQRFVVDREQRAAQRPTDTSSSGHSTRLSAASILRPRGLNDFPRQQVWDRALRLSSTGA